MGMGGACSAHEIVFARKNLKGRDYLKDINKDG
jgi:hypothetical protein